MKIISTARVLALVALVSLSATGCATYTTISSANAKSAKVYSGTRLDAMAIADIRPHTEKFKVAPPEHPVLDLPLSIVLDTMIFPLTFSVATYEFFFE